MQLKGEVLMPATAFVRARIDEKTRDEPRKSWPISA